MLLSFLVACPARLIAETPTFSLRLQDRPLESGEPADAFVNTQQVDSSWTFELTPYVWAASISGNAEFGPIEAEPDVAFLDLVKHLDLGLMLHFQATHDNRWGLFFDGLHMSLSGDSTVDLGRIPLFPGVGVDGRFRQTMLKFGAFYRFPQENWHVDLMVGGQYLDIKLDFDVGPLPSLDLRKSVLNPIVGARANIALSDEWNAIVMGDIGGFGAGMDLVWEATAFLGYRLSDTTTLRFGYRAQSIQNSGSSIDLDILLHGPIVGIVFSF
jgi:hypothetical protein